MQNLSSGRTRDADDLLRQFTEYQCKATVIAERRKRFAEGESQSGPTLARQRRKFGMTASNTVARFRRTRFALGDRYARLPDLQRRGPGQRR